MFKSIDELQNSKDAPSRDSDKLIYGWVLFAMPGLGLK